MKKLLALLLLSLSLFSFTPSNLVSNTKDGGKNKTEKTSPNACKYGQCQATAKSTGNQCKHCVSNSGDYYCYQHK